MRIDALNEQVKILAERAARLYVKSGSGRFAPPGLPQSNALPPAEARALDKAGLDIDDRVASGAADPAAETVQEYMGILASAMTVRDAAGLLGVDPSRIRQMIRDRSLAAIEENHRYLIPRFQFVNDRPIPSFSSVFSATPGDVPLILFYRWFVQPSCDLPAGEEQRDMSPREWLLSGYDPEVVVKIASLL